MVDPERGVEMELQGDSNEVSGSPTTQFGMGTVMDYEMGLMFSSLSPLDPSLTVMDYEMGSMFSSLSPLDPSFDHSVSQWNPPSPGRWPQSPEFEISLWNFPSPSRWPSPEPGFSRLISSYGSASSSNQPPVRSPSPPLREQGDLSLKPSGLIFVVRRHRCVAEHIRRRHRCVAEHIRQRHRCVAEHIRQLHIHIRHRCVAEHIRQLHIHIQQLYIVELSLQQCLGLQQLLQSNEMSELHKFIQNASQITLQVKIKMAHEICKEGHDNTSIEILDKMTVVTDVFKLHFSWTKAPCRHRSQNNASDLEKSCTSFDGCYKHQDCMSTVKLEIDFYVDDMEIFQKLFSSRRPFLCSEYTLVRYGRKIESQSFHAICEPIAPADDVPDSRCELTHISHCTRSPPGPNGLQDGEEMPQQDSTKHQLMGETHAMNDGENAPSYGGIHSAVSYPENEGTRKTLKRKHGKNKIQIPLEDLLNFSGTLMDAVKQFQVSKSTIKRHCRQHGITNWQYRTIDNNSQSLSKPKDIIESIQGEGAEMGNQMAGGSRPCERELNHGQIGSDRSQIGVGLMEESSTQLETTPMGNMFASSTHEQCIEAVDHSELPLQPSKSNLSAARRLDAVNSILPQIPEREFLIENSGSSRELSDHYISATEAFNAKQVPDSSRTNLSCSDPAPKLDEATASDMMPLLERRTMTIKATYRKVKIRFQLSLTSGIIDLRKEVAKRLPLEVGTFGIEYLDDDNEWILMTCDADLQECFNISKSLNCNVIKLLIQDIMPISGAPYEAMDN